IAVEEMEGLILIAAALVCVCIVLPIVAFVRTNKIRSLALRLDGVEAALLRLMRQQTAAQTSATTPEPARQPPEVPPPPAVEPIARPSPTPTISTIAEPAEHLEAVIGQKWLGWVAVVLIFVAAA